MSYSSALQALAAFVGDCQDNALLEDMLLLLLVALQPSNPGCATAVAGLHAIGGPRVLLSLLSRSSQTIRLLGLKLLSAFAAVTRPTGASAPQSGLPGELCMSMLSSKITHFFVPQSGPPPPPPPLFLSIGTQAHLCFRVTQLVPVSSLYQGLMKTTLLICMYIWQLCIIQTDTMTQRATLLHSTSGVFDRRSECASRC